MVRKEDNMFIRIFVKAISKEEALIYSNAFESFISNSVVALKNTKIEQYWKIPEQYCVEFEFKDVISERLHEAAKKIGNNPHITTNGETIGEYIFSRTTGEIYLENIEWILINIEE